ncbi:5-oxoprolinase subunit B family protein [Sphaerobacter thermophilus]|uniref:Urea carboxylase n=1 Tax=Sphaerobacter thermophilus (strain ATCC 49802 / DSM 20745 / KCCM 41009 / NCIMB 13125 / S 6022) TaxID=479434 RepID=D1C8S9_SPHTD|nr:allophanate hydrolase subunit 1 [Sphaerobacter thermophilus]ACZ40222.1 Urea carboxylase [Sphaerobacter thermophilus DSM 20745]
MAQHDGQTSGVILASVPAKEGRPKIVYRQAGDRFMLVEFGDMEFDLTMSFRVLGLNQALKDHGLDGLIETVPAIRSILIHYDSTRLKPDRLIQAVEDLYEQLPPFETLTIPSRRISLPIAFNDRWTRADIARYVEHIRKDAPNIINGNNLEYGAMYNGLRDAEELMEYVMATEWWSAAIGFFPGLPFLYPLDRRYAIVLPKYNPTRPWTPEGAVGIAGPCLAIYPVASAGGYQLFGRTIPIYDPKQRNAAFAENPILLRPGDRVTFGPRVTDEELIEIREAVYNGTYEYQIDHDATFDVGEYLRFLEETREEAEAFRRRQEEAAQRTPVP